jgi:hypothetical protein
VPKEQAEKTLLEIDSTNFYYLILAKFYFLCIAKGKGATVIATDSLSTMMAVEGTRWTKNPKTRRIRELLDQETEPLRYHGNERADDEAAKNA